MREHKHLVDRIKFSELNEIYWVASLRVLAISFIDVFIPVYLYKLGYTFVEIFLFFALVYGFKVLAERLTARLSAKIGPKHGIALSFPLFLLYLWMFSTLPIYNWSLIFLAFISGLANALFWISYHTDFSKVKHNKVCSTEISKAEILTALCGAIAPFIGGYIAYRWNISFSFLLAIFVLVLATFPLFKTSKPHIPRSLDMKKINLKKILPDLLSYAGLGIDDAVGGYIWPFFIFFILETYENVGAVQSLTLLVMVIATFLIGKYSDQKDRHQVLKRGGVINSIVWFIKIFTQTTFQVLVFNIINAIILPFIRLPFISEFYIHADEESRLEYIVLMEETIDLSRTLFFLILMGLAFYLPIKAILILGLLIAGFGTLLVSFMRPTVYETTNIAKEKIKAKIIL